MAIGETVVGTLWTSFAGVCIEKLLDELLKVGRLDVSCWIFFQFGLVSERRQSETFDIEGIARSESFSDESNVVGDTVSHDQFK